ncbi:nucleoside hydrolase [Herbiconiux sp. P15]|uniref:nucleoside hydrolase n=1 Tax=Herbiconiux liukaitaii TaxID=3342799 RepID=UPI0035BAA72B
MKVIIDCDPGNAVPGANVDDGLAIALAVAARDRLDLLAITIVAGNTPNRIGYAAAQTLLGHFDVDVPLYLGADRALVEDPTRWRAHLDRGARDAAVANLWEDTPRPQPFRTAPAMPAAQAIGELVAAHPGEVTIVAIGPLTNIALALRLYPDLAADVSRIVIMGGVFDVDGYLVDTNFGFDPEAAAIVLGSGAAVTLIPMDVSTRTMLLHEDLDRLERIDSRLTRYLIPTLRPWVTYSAATRNIPGTWIHDVVAVALLLDPTIVTSRSRAVTVELAPGPTRGRASRWTPGSLATHGDPRVVEPAPIDVLEGIDNTRLLDLITESLAAAADG